jgi:hypothetical protein
METSVADGRLASSGSVFTRIIVKLCSHYDKSDIFYCELWLFADTIEFPKLL